MNYKLQAYSIHEFGKRKDSKGNPHQEDSIYPAHEKATANDRLFIVCDGMGGHAAGEVASRAVCEAMSATITGSRSFDEQVLDRAVNAAYDSLDRLDRSEDAHSRMGTTLTLLKLHEGGATIAHIGDSRVYHIRPNAEGGNEVLFRTRDHSLVNDLITIGSITPEEAKHHPQRNVITRAMQPHLEERFHPDIYNTADVKAGDYFYLCSDGMLEEMEDINLCNILRDDVTDEVKVAMLRDATADNKDNHSAYLVHIVEVDDTPKKVKKSEPEKAETEEKPQKVRSTMRPSWFIIVLAVAIAVLAVILFMNK